MTNDTAPASSTSVRRRAAGIVLAGVALIVGGGVLLSWFIERQPDYAKTVALPFFVGFALLLEGVVELATNKAWSSHSRGARVAFLVLGTPVAAAAVVGAFLLVYSLAGRG